MNSGLDHSKIDEFSKTDGDFEPQWTEIKNDKKKNIICGCIYRHPNTDSFKFIEYIESNFFKIDCKKYEVWETSTLASSNMTVVLSRMTLLIP